MAVCNTFIRSKRHGEAGEEAYITLLTRAGLITERNETNQRSSLSRWDIATEINGIRLTAEVKHDLYESKTGNIAVEFYNPRANKPSGIRATASDLWVIVLSDGSIWACATNDLIAYFEFAKYERDVVAGGDGNATFRLYRRDQLFNDLFIRLDTIPHDDLPETLVRKAGYDA